MSALHVLDRLKQLDLEKLRADAYADIRSGKKTRRKDAVKRLRALEGMKRAGASPEDLVIRKVPVIPAGFRPYTAAGDTFIPGDANELYSDLIKARDLYRETSAELGPVGAAETGQYLRQAVKAVYGYDDSPNPKLEKRQVTGFLRKLLGSGPKQSWVQKKMISKPQDFVGRGVISPDPDLGMDEINIPEDMAWELYDPYIRRRLIAQGIQASRAIRLIKDRDTLARQQMLAEMRQRPVLYSRAPAWHKFNTISGYAKPVEGDNIYINTFVTGGAGADFDGDTMAIHAPSLSEAVKDAKEKLLPSKMLFSVRNRDETLPQPKHEQLLGLSSAQLRPSGTIHAFGTEAEALAAVKAGTVKLHDTIELPD